MTRMAGRARLGLQSLEPRDTPAGVVAVSFLNGSLTLVGDAAANGIGISAAATGTPSRLTINAPDGNTTFRLNGLPAQAAVTLPADLTGNITIRAGDGNDTIAFRNVNVPGSVRVDGGEGDNSVILIDMVEVARNLSVVNGSGYDRVSLDGLVDVHGSITINNRAGGSQLYSEDAARVRAGSLAVLNGAGFDRFDVFGELTTAGNLSIRNGPGGSLLQAGVYTDLSVGGALSVVSGAGADEIHTNNAFRIRAGSISIRPGPDRSDTSLVSATEVTVAGNLTFAGGSGFDLILVGQTSVPTTVGGKVSIAVGAGGSSVDLRGSVVTVTGDVGVRAGAGADVVSLSSYQTGQVGGGVVVGLGGGDAQTAYVTDLVIAGSLRVSTAAVTNADAVNLIGVTVGKDTAVTTGAANDQVMISYGTFAGPVTISTGAGNDSVEIENSIIPGISYFHGPVTVRTGDGNDSIAVGYNAPLFGQWAWAVFSADARFDGGRGTADHITIESFNTFAGPRPVLTGFEP